MKAYSVPALFFSGILGACASISAGSDKPDKLKRADQPFVYDTRASIGPCPGDVGESFGIETIGTAIIAQGVNRIGAAIKAAAAEETKQVLVRRNLEVSKGDTFGPCLLVARGWYYDSPMPDEDRMYVGKQSDFDYAAKIDSIRRSGLPLAGNPDFFFEARFITSQDKSATTLEPIFAYLDEPISKSWFRRSKTRRVMVNFALSEVGKSANFSKGQGSTMVLGTLESGTPRVFPAGSSALVGVTCDGVTGCTIDQAKQIMRNSYEADWFALTLPDKPKPMTLQVLMSETRSASAFWKFVSDVFGDIDDSVTSDLQQALIPSTGAAAEEKDKAAKEALNTTYDQAYAKASTSLAACIDAPTDVNKASEARVALRALNKAARALEKEEQFSENDIDSIDLQSGSFGADCMALVGLL